MSDPEIADRDDNEDDPLACPDCGGYWDGYACDCGYESGEYEDEFDDDEDDWYDPQYEPERDEWEDDEQDDFTEYGGDV